MEKNGQIYCDECHLGICKQPHRTVTREARAGNPARIAHFHNRDDTDCWSRALKKAKALAQTTTVVGFARKSEVIL